MLTPGDGPVHSSPGTTTVRRIPTSDRVATDRRESVRFRAVRDAWPADVSGGALLPDRITADRTAARQARRPRGSVPPSRPRPASRRARGHPAAVSGARNDSRLRMVIIIAGSDGSCAAFRATIAITDCDCSKCSRAVYGCAEISIAIRISLYQRYLTAWAYC